LRQFIEQNAQEEKTRFPFLVSLDLLPPPIFLTCLTRNSHEELNPLPSLDVAMMELLSFEEAELLSMIHEAETERSTLQEKLKNCNRDLESQMEAIQEEDQKLETIVKQFS
jgi:hypothetical protein